MGDKLKIHINDRSKTVVKFLLMLFVIGIFIGVYAYLIQDTNTKNAINLELTSLLSNLANVKQNSIIYHFITISLMIILSLSVIGLPLVLFYYFYEGISIGFLITSFIKYKKFKGFTYSLIFTGISKLLYIAILTYFLVQSLNYALKILKNIKENKKDLIIRQLIKCAFTIGICFINDIILYFIGNKLASIFTFIIN